MATENRLTVTAEIQRRCTELVLGSEKFNVKLLPLFLESLGCCLSKSEVEEIIASVPKKKFTGNTLPCVTLSKVISKLIKRRMYEPPSYDEVVEVVSKLDVAKTGYLDGKEFVAFIAATMPAFTPGELEEIRSTVADEDNRVSLVCLKNQMQTPPSAFSIYRYMEELMVNGLDVEDPEEDELSEDSEDVKFGQHGDEDGGDEEPEIGV
ncbi:hypothetical protein M8J77_012181 [Diaphorina citri]|nr:hypothetical protein M8J77_012181 [Diaphorina citri]